MPFLAYSDPDDGTRHGEVQCYWALKGVSAECVTRDPGALEHPRWFSRVWICRECGETWCTEAMLDHDQLQPFEIVESTCGCRPDIVPSYGEVNGSLTMSTRYPTDTLNTLPPSLAKREIKILLEA